MTKKNIWLESICKEFENTINFYESSNSQKLNLKFNENFDAMAELKPVIQRMRWWTKEFRSAIESDDKKK